MSAEGGEEKKGTGRKQRSWRLVDLRAQWLTEGAKRQPMGVSFLCPGHLEADHRVAFWFLNPTDGGPPRPNLTALYFREGASLTDLTLTSGLVLVRDKQPLAQLLVVEGHWEGYVYHGRALDAP